MLMWPKSYIVSWALAPISNAIRTWGALQEPETEAQACGLETDD